MTAHFQVLEAKLLLDARIKLSFTIFRYEFSELHIHLNKLLYKILPVYIVKNETFRLFNHFQVLNNLRFS